MLFCCGKLGCFIEFVSFRKGSCKVELLFLSLGGGGGGAERTAALGGTGRWRRVIAVRTLADAAGLPGDLPRSSAAAQAPGKHPASGFCGFRTRRLVCEKRFVWLRLVDLSRTPIGTFFREVHPGSEIARQNHKDMTWHAESWRFVTEPRSHGLASGIVRPQALLGPAASVLTRL